MERKQISINGILDSWGYQRSNVNYLLNRYKDMPVLCVVNSLGGNVNEGLAISKLFEQHGDVVVRFIGCCASAATWMAFGAKEIEIAEDAFLMVHNCSNLISIYKSMKIEDIESTIKELESVKKSQEAFNLTVAKKYADRAIEKKTMEDIITLMAEERWMTANEAMEWGFVDRVIPGVNRMNEESRNQIVQNCVALNLPAPHFRQPEEKSIVRDLLDGLKGLMTGNAVKNDVEIEDGHREPAKPSATEDSTNNQSNNQKCFAMNKKFVNLIALLAIASNEVTEEDGNVTLDMEQLGRIENALAEAKQHGQQLKDVEDVLDSVSDNVKNMEGVKNKALALKGLVGQFPIQAPAGNQLPAGASDAKQQKLDETAKDGINQEMRAFYNARNRK
ncbi:MAG: Clp protease ClpP [Bacteroidaceae bacterium]|nr:Clp protease ClpP [Bacteroidaceae bacterium]